MSKNTAGLEADEPTLSRLKVRKIDVARPAGDQIFLAIKQAILRMDLPPGCIVSEADVGAKFGSSRTPVREAFMRLREAGLVTTLPSRGNFVSHLNRDKILEARFLREALEMANIKRLVETGLPDESRSAIQHNLELQSAASKNADSLGFARHDDAFHLLLANATGYPRAAEVLEREKMALDRLRVLSLSDVAHLTTLLEEHRALFDAICRRDLDSAVSVGEIHFRSILKVLSNLVSQQAEYFGRSESEPRATADADAPRSFAG